MIWIASFWSSSSFWEGVEYVAEAIVITGAVFEVLTDFEYILKGDEKKGLRLRIEKFAAMILIFGLAVELGALVRTNEISSLTIASLNKEAGFARRDAADADERAANANRDAGTARLDASNANALAKQYQAQIAASDARAKTADARSAEASAKAEGFRLDIAKANEGASPV
jgi:hypothetical protein